MTSAPAPQTTRPPWRTYAALATNGSLLLLGLVYIQYSRDGIREFDTEINTYPVDLLWQIGLFCAGWLLVRFAPVNRWTLRVVLGVAVGAQLVGVLAPQFLSSDVDRYVWDGRVQAAGVNPYRYVPSDPHLTKLRDDNVYASINRKDYAHTIYPPGAQLLFLAVTRIADTETGMKLAMVAMEGVACWAMLDLLVAFGRRREEVLLFAWHPLAMWEIASSGHIDGGAIGLLLLAALARLRGKPLRAALWVTAAAMVKLFPIVLWPALVRRTNWRASLKYAAVCAGVVLAGYALYSSVGAGVFGFLDGYAKEEGLDDGDRYFLLAWVRRTWGWHVLPGVYNGLCVAAVLGLALWAWRRARTPKQSVWFALAIATVLTILFSPHYVWYFLWLIPFAALVEYVPVMVLTLAAVYYYSLTLADPGQMNYDMNDTLYTIFAAALALDLLVRVARWWWVRRRGAPARETVLAGGHGLR